MTQRVNLYGESIEVTDSEADGVIDYLIGREFETESAPLGFAIAPQDAGADWRRGYAMAVFGISDRKQLQI